MRIIPEHLVESCIPERNKTINTTNGGAFSPFSSTKSPFPDELDRLYNSVKIMGKTSANNVEKALLNTLDKFNELEELKSKMSKKINELKSKTNRFLKKETFAIINKFRVRQL